MKHLITSLTLVLISGAFMHIKADPGDTLIVQTYTFEEQNNPETAYDSPGRRYFDFPADDGTSYQKILMYYTLKCFEDGTAGGLGYDCGEWDYTSHSFLYEHTGVLDSNALSHPEFLVNNLDFDSIQLSTFPVISSTNYEFPQTIITSITNESEFSLNSAISDTLKFEEGSSGRIQWYYSVADLLTAGVDASINKISIFNPGSFSELTNLQIRAIQVSEEPNELINEGLEDYFYHPSEIVSSGQFDFLLDQELIWNGESGILFDFSFDSCGSEFCLLGGAGNSHSIHNTEDKYITFDGGDQISVPYQVLSTLDEEVTIGYWLYGTEEFQPENGTTFEGVNADNQRVLNVHNPWGNGQVYWDAGDDNGYDRINAQANEEDYSGQWNHWAFTKNTNTGQMKIFLNGEEWLSGENNDNSLAGITRFSIGAAAGWSNFYRGSMDDFFIVGKELNSLEIQSYMNEEYSQTLPHIEDLLGYFGFNHEYGELAHNEVSDWDGVPLGNAKLELHKSEDALSEINSISFTPWLSLFNGEYETQNIIQGYSVLESTTPVSVVEYEVNGNSVEISDYSILYPEDYQLLIDSNGNPIDSFSNINTTLYNSSLNYYSVPFEIVNRIELGRFITPYGIGLDLEEGWTWIYDVTDFEPLLHGEVELEAGNWQELLDLKFLFIEGTPPRDVIRVENIWAGNWGLGSWDENIEEKTVQVQEGEEMFKMRTTTSGHGFGSGNNCAEFCFNNHKLKVNGNTEYSWEIMQECADNPLYPQGGTWVYDRAGWCPGAPVRMREHELTPFISGDEFSLEYDIDYDPDGNYWFMGQLFSYSELNHGLDVELDQILAPSDFRINSRMNPICNDPIIRIKNKGAEVLTTCEIEYGINGQMETYTWTGELGFNESADVTLTYNQDESFYQGDDELPLRFSARVSAPNGGADQNPSNNATSSSFYRPPTYSYDEDDDDNRIIVETLTNATPSETRVELRNMDGSIHWSRGFTDANTQHRDTLTLNAGCYLLHVSDSGDDGLNFFANNDGTGRVRLREVGGFFFEIFENNFGKEINHYFNFETNIYDAVIEEKLTDVQLFPNPSEGLFYLKGTNVIGNVEIEIFNSLGELVKEIDSRLTDSASSIELNLEGQTSGLYNAIITHNGEKYLKRLILF